MPDACIGLNYSTKYGALTLNDIGMHRLAWDVLNVADLWGSAKTRGEDRIVPGSDGVRSYRRRPTTTTVTLNLVITGVVDPDGTPYTDPVDGLFQNIWYLRQYVADPRGSGDGTIPLELLMPDGSTWGADVTIEDGLQLGDMMRYHRRAVLDVVLPLGSIAELVGVSS